jgi:hypothetical protein
MDFFYHWFQGMVDRIQIKVQYHYSFNNFIGADYQECISFMAVGKFPTVETSYLDPKQVLPGFFLFKFISKFNI